MKLSENLESLRREVDSLSAQTSELTQGKIRKYFIYNFIKASLLVMPTSRTFCLGFMFSLYASHFQSETHCAKN